MLFNEPKLLKYNLAVCRLDNPNRFSALQRAEIAEILFADEMRAEVGGFSALQRAEIAEIVRQR